MKQCGGLLTLLLLCPASIVDAATVHGSVTINGATADGAVVYLENVEEPQTAPTPPRVTMDQRNLHFVPYVLPVQRGTVVEFRNSDDVQHNVFTPSEAGDHFDLGTYSHGETRSVSLTRPGELVVLCNIHMEMEAHILVLRDPSFAVSGPNGVYRIAAVPPGTYKVRVWQERWLEDGRTVEVPDTSDLRVDASTRR